LTTRVRLMELAIEGVIVAFCVGFVIWYVVAKWMALPR
jgi:hypothetical protein